MKRKKKKNKPIKKGGEFSRNLTLLKGRFPHLWELVQATKRSNRSPQQKQNPTEKGKPRADHIQKIKLLFYRDEDPILSVKKNVETWNFDPYDVVFVIGMGLGHLPLEALKKGIGNPRMVIIEPSEQIFRNALEHTDLEPLLTNDRVDLFVGDDVPIANIIERYQDKIPIGKNQIIVHEGYDKVLGNTILPIKQELTERIRAVRDNWHTTQKYGQQMFTNAVANLPSLFAGTPMKNLRGKLKGIPAVCIAAGPSLDDSIPDLKKLQKHALLIACDSAVNALLKAGIHPNIVVTVDIFETNIDKLKPHFEALCETVLIYSIESNPDNVRQYIGAKRVAVSAYSKLLHFWIDPAFKLESKFPAMTSVSHMAIFSAMALGADPIIMVGMDLSYSKGKSHSFDSSFFHSLDHKKLVSTYCTNGSMIASSPQFVADKLLIEKIVGNSGVRFCNTSVSGAYVAGTEIKRLKEIVDIETTSQRDVGEILKTIDWQPVSDDNTVATTIENLIEEFVKFKQLCSNKKKEILNTIETIKSTSNAGFDLNVLVEFENALDTFEKNNQFYKHMIKEIMLTELQELFKQKETLSLCSDKMGHDTLLENLKLLTTYYEIYEKGMDFYVDQLKKFNIYVNGLSALSQVQDPLQNDWGKHLDLARYFEEHDELWQAKREYNYCIETQPENATPYLELAQAFMKAHLWKSVQELTIRACAQFHDAPEIHQLEMDLETGINRIFEEIKTEWMQGNIHTTRKLLNQYLILCPDDLQALELKKVIRELDEEFSGEWVDGKTEKTAIPDMQARSHGVVQLIKSGQFEKGIGILEGIIEDFPDRRGVLREQAGDIRMMQKDYESALWNYTQSLELNPRKIEIINKIKRIKSMKN